MNRNTLIWSLAALALLLLLLVAGTVLAQTDEPGVASGGPAYALAWRTVDGGGGSSSSPGGQYALSGTIGQPDAGDMAGQLYTGTGGFWGPSSNGGPRFRIYLPLVAREG